MFSSPKEEELQQSPIGKPKKEIKSPVFIEADTLNDLARLVCALERVPLPLFSIEIGNETILATQLDLFMGIPVFYFAYTKQFRHYLGYRTSQNGEEVSLVDSPSNSSLIHSPIIEIVRMPLLFERSLRDLSNSKAEVKDERFLPMQVKDLVSLVKVASYKMLFDEPPMPIFAFQNKANGHWRIGSFARTEDYEEDSIFFYYEQETKPEQNFVRYSMSKAEALLTNRTDEHGYVYMKIIKLKENHPLVEES